MTKILLTRPLEQAQSFANALTLRGVPADDIVISPIIRIEDAHHPQRFPKDAEFVITSSNALKMLRFDPNGRRAYCVGEATTKRARNAGFAAENYGQTATDLIASLDGDQRPLVYLSGHVIAANPPDHWIRAIVYEQIPQSLSDQAMDLLERGTGVLLPLFSTRSARLVTQADINWTEHIAVVISNSVAIPCRKAGLTQLHVAKRPDVNSVLWTICDYIDIPYG